MDAGTEITIVVSNGKKPEDKVNVTNFTGKDESALLKWAQDNGMKVQKQAHYSDQPEGTIISQNPSSGKLEKGATISYELSLGPEPSQGNDEPEDEAP